MTPEDLIKDMHQTIAELRIEVGWLKRDLERQKKETRLAERRWVRQYNQARIVEEEAEFMRKKIRGLQLLQGGRRV